MHPQTQTIDCRGMRCPAPILQLSKASRAANGSKYLRVLADDGDFPTDLRAWCQSTGARVESLSDSEGFFSADIVLAHDEARTPTPVAAQPRVVESPTTRIDCSGMRCPAPILAIAKAHKATDAPSCLEIIATDGDFPTDLEAWCRSTGSTLFQLEESNGTYVAFVGVKGLTQPPSALPSAPKPAVSPAPAAAAPVDALDLRADDPQMVLLRVGQHSMATPTFTFLAPKSPELERQLSAWAGAMGIGLALRSESGHLIGQIGGPSAAVGGAAHTNVPTAPSAVAAPTGIPRENKATLLVLHNDFEPLMAALMVANASAAQGMAVEIYFSFWGVNFLRGPRNTPVASTALEKPSILKKMMKLMMPAGPDRQQLSKMNFGGAGVGMMRHFMKQDNILSMRELMNEAIELDVKFVICTMSMGLMGVSKADLMDLPNIEFGGVTAFSSSARTAASSMVF